MLTSLDVLVIDEAGTQAEIEVFERWFGDLFDELFGSSDS